MANSSTDGQQLDLKVPHEHWAGLSALRAMAMLLGITLHAAVPYMRTPMKGLFWGVQETPSLVCEIAFWWVHAWRVPLFFFLAGFFAKLTMDRYGVQQFAKKRFDRIVAPYFIAMFTIGPALYLILAVTWYLTDQCTLEQIWPHVPLPQQFQTNIFGAAHLWFLLDLMIMTVVYAGLSFVLPIAKSAVQAGDQKTAVSKWIPLFAAAPAGFLLWGDLSPVLAHHNTFLIDSSRLLYFSVYFIGGIVAYQHRDWFLGAARYPRTHLLLAVPASVLYMTLIQNELIDLNSVTGRLVMGFTTAVTTWLMIYGLMGYFLHRGNSEHPVISYLADSSYWVYLVHLPIVLLLQLGLHWVPISVVAKFLIVSGVSAAVGLLSYHCFVRNTIIGRYLHGPRSGAATNWSGAVKNLATVSMSIAPESAGDQRHYGQAQETHART